MIRAKGLCVDRRHRGGDPVRVLEGVELGVGPGELLLLLGRAGAGKTTLLETLAALREPVSGFVEIGEGRAAVRWGEGNPDALPTRRPRVGLLFQVPERQLFGRTAAEDVGWGLSKGAEASGCVAEVLESAGVPRGAWDSPLNDLSRSEKRRVALAGVLARQPSALLLDEPAVGTDAEGQEKLLGVVDGYRRRTAAAVVVATHWAEPWLRRADQVLCLDQGRVCFGGSVSDLRAASRIDPRLAALLPFGERLRLAASRDAARAHGNRRWEGLARLVLDNLPGG